MSLSETLESGEAIESASSLPVRASHLDHSAMDLLLSRFAAILYEERRRRERFLPGDLFADPAWDLLLYLYIAGSEGRTVSVSSVCIALAIPESTALRWIGLLVDRDLVSRKNDEVDEQRGFIALSAEGFLAMRGYFECVANDVRTPPVVSCLQV